MSYIKPKDPRLLFVPLGGCGEIGMNLNLYGHKGRWLMVDCGMSFAGEEAPGVDLIFPDTSFIEEEKARLDALVVTHGHEDHIGAIPFLWPYLECPIYATPFTAELIREKLVEEGLEDDVPLHVIGPETDINIGPFGIRYQPLAHSIAEGHGLVIETGAGTVFHTGDWKLDSRPLIGPASPSGSLEALGDKGVLALVGDSTNIFNPSESGSEAAVRESLYDIVKGLRGRVILTTFASNVARLDTAGFIARKTGRQVALIGRSMKRIYRVAKETGYLQDFPPIVEEEAVSYLPPDKVLVLCTGCQGEPRAALSRIARGDHKEISLVEGDTVIFSSKIIPGNEKSIGVIFNMLAERGIDFITEKSHFIHVSGHPGREELAKMMAWTRPKAVIPVHGEAQHLRRHADFAREQGIDHVIVPKNGDVIEISETGLKRIDHVHTGRFALDGHDLVSITSPSILERRRVMFNGVVSVSVTLSSASRLTKTPLVDAMGIPRGHTQELRDILAGEIEDAFDYAAKRDRTNDGGVEQIVRLAVRRYCRSELGKNPQVMVLINRVK